MNRKLKNMEYLLNFGSLILLFAILFIVGNISDYDGLVKVISGIVCSLGLFGLSYVIDKNLKMTGSAKLIHYEASFLLAWFYLMAGELEIFGEWFTMFGEGEGIFYAIWCFMLSSLLVLTHVRFKDYKYINFSYVSTLFGIFFIFEYLSLTMLENLLIINVLILVYYLLSKKERTYNYLRYLLSISVLFSTFFVDSDVVLTSALLLIVNLVSVISIAIKSKDKESKLFAVGTYYWLLFASAQLISVSDEVSIVIIACLACLADLLLNYFVKYFNEFSLKFNKIVNTVFITALCIISLNMHYMAFVMISIFVFISSITTLLVFKNDKAEKYFFPVKVGLFVYSLLILFSRNIYDVPELVMIFVMNLVYLALFKMSKEQKIRSEHTVLALVLLAYGLIISGGNSIINFIAILFMMLLDYLVLVISLDKDSTLLGKTVYTLMLGASLISLLIYDIGDVKYLVETIFLLVLFIANDKVKYNTGITIPVLAITLNTYITSVITDAAFSDIITNIIWIVSSLLFSHYMFEKTYSKDKFLSTLLGVVMAIFIISNAGNMLETIYALSIIVVGMICASKFYYKKLFNTGIAIGVLSLFMILTSVDGIPASVYLLVLGIGVIGFAIYMISKYTKEENEKVRFCEECGTKLIGNVENCTKCGKKVVD